LARLGQAAYRSGKMPLLRRRRKLTSRCVLQARTSDYRPMVCVPCRAGLARWPHRCPCRIDFCLAACFNTTAIGKSTSARRLHSREIMVASLGIPCDLRRSRIPSSGNCRLSTQANLATADGLDYLKRDGGTMPGAMDSWSWSARKPRQYAVGAPSSLARRASMRRRCASPTMRAWCPLRACMASPLSVSH
jgi:hypothetical protein